MPAALLSLSLSLRGIFLQFCFFFLPSQSLGQSEGRDPSPSADSAAGETPGGDEDERTGEPPGSQGLRKLSHTKSMVLPETRGPKVSHEGWGNHRVRVSFQKGMREREGVAVMDVRGWLWNRRKRKMAVAARTGWMHQDLGYILFFFSAPRQGRHHRNLSQHSFATWVVDYPPPGTANGSTSNFPELMHVSSSPFSLPAPQQSQPAALSLRCQTNPKSALLVVLGSAHFPCPVGRGQRISIGGSRGKGPCAIGCGPGGLNEAKGAMGAEHRLGEES